MRVFIVVLAAAVLCGLTAVPLRAQNIGAVIAAISNPDRAGLAARIRNLVLRNPALVRAVIARLGGLTPEQRTAVGLGLAQAAVILQTSNPQGAEIVSAAVASSNAEFKAAFAASVQTVQFASTAGSTGSTQSNNTATSIGGGGGSTASPN